MISISFEFDESFETIQCDPGLQRGAIRAACSVTADVAAEGEHKKLLYDVLEKSLGPC